MTEEPTIESVLRVHPLAEVSSVINDATQLEIAIADLAQGTGYLAVDAERASGYKYSQRAYLLQLYRSNSAVHLIDPIGLDISKLVEFMNPIPWILHAATQDLPCLNEIGLHPRKLFDTELAAKILGLPKVGLATLTETLLNISLAKEHSAVDWSIRPLQQSWLTYAALDVELLPELHQVLSKMLLASNRDDWAEQEFEHLKQFRPKPPNPEAWRKTSGMHELINKRQKAIIKELWQLRDAIAQDLDIAPGKLLNDRVLIAIAKNPPKAAADLSLMHGIAKKPIDDYRDQLFARLNVALTLPDDQLPISVRKDSPVPHPRTWPEVKPEAAKRWNLIRTIANQAATDVGVSPEVLISPEILKQFAWHGLTNYSKALIEARLLDLGCRPWQITWSSNLEPVLSEMKSN
jgi:ribonuclease D